MLFDEMSAADAPVTLLRRMTRWSGKQANGWLVGTVHADQALLVADSTGFGLCLQSGSSTAKWREVVAVHVSEELEARIVDRYATHLVRFKSEADLREFRELALSVGAEVAAETEPPAKRPKPPRSQPAGDLTSEQLAHSEMRKFSAQNTIVMTRTLGILLTVAGVFAMGYSWPGLNVDANGTLVREGNVFWLGVGAIVLFIGQGALWFGIIADAVRFGIHASREE